MEKTNLNVSPYYDDFDESDNFHRVLFRPSYAVQARELTTLQTILQNQMDKFGRHTFKEGAMVIPGNVGYTTDYYAVKLQDTFSSASIAGNISDYVGTRITGATSGVIAEVIEAVAATSTDEITLYVKYTKTGTNNILTTFSDGENISSDGAIGSYSADAASATTKASDATATGSSCNIQAGVYFIRGHFVQVAAERIILDKYTNTPSYRVGLTITETLVTPEADTSLQDNATGATNYAAKGAHRLKISCALSKLAIGSSEDTNFVELLRIKNGILQDKVRPDGDYSILGDNLAKRTFEESGNYNVKPYSIELRETLDNSVNNGLYSSGGTTDSGNTADEKFLTVHISGGSSYVSGYRYEQYAPSFIDIEKPRTFDYVNAAIAVQELGNFVIATNVNSIPELSPADAGDVVPFKPILLYDTATANTTNATSLLAEALDTSETAIDVDDGSEFKLLNVIEVGTEQMKITAISSNTLTVTRGFNSTTAATHSDNAQVKKVLGGAASGTNIGVARVRAIEHSSGTNSTNFISDVRGNSSEIKFHLFDVRMFTVLTLNGTPSPVIPAGSKVTGVTSGATGFAFADTSGTGLTLVSVNGTFSSGEKITESDSAESDQIVENSSNADLTISSIATHGFSKVKQLYSGKTDSSDIDFSADVKLTDEFTLSGTYRTETSGSDNLIGVSGFDTSEVIVGEVVVIPTGTAGATEERIVDAVTSTAISFTVAPTTDAITTANIVRKRAILNEQTQNIAIRKLPKRRIKTLLTDTNSGVSDTTIQVRRQFVAIPNSSGIITLTAGSNETFNTATNANYTIAIVQRGTGGTGDAGDIVDITGTNVATSGTGSGTLTITSTTVFGTTGDFHVQVLASLTRTVVGAKAKTLKSSKTVIVANVGSTANRTYGCDASDGEISLGRADCFRLRAVYESLASGTNAVAPTLTTGTITGTFQRGEIITGGTSGAKGFLIKTTSPLQYVLATATDFSSTEALTGATSGATATATAKTDGDTVVTSDFTLDTGQRDNYYDISRIVRKPGVPAPTGKLLVVFDYFEHGTGDLFTVDSYPSSGVEFSYKDIPVYSATRTDPDVREPTGQYFLSDCADFRPRVADIAGASATVEDVDTITGYSFDFASRVFNGTGSSITDMCQDGTNIQADIDYFLARKSSLFLTTAGEFKVVDGAPAGIGSTSYPKPLDNAMKLADFDFQPYVRNIKDDTKFYKMNHKRYTMRDIGLLEDRIKNIEYYTALSMLENETQSFEVQDENGLNRFKSGFVVDNFSGHRVGNVNHKDYRVSVDMQFNELRPKYFMKGIDLTEENTTTAERTADGYQKTGDVVTLPYTHSASITQPYATTTENLNPFLQFVNSGTCILNPSGDEWFETQFNPDVILFTGEGNFDTILAENQNAIGTIWNAWETQWSGVTEFIRMESRWAPGAATNGLVDIVQEFGQSSRTGINRQVVEQIDTEVVNNRLVSTGIVPFVRARNVTFTATGMKPNTKVYPYFDKELVTAYVTPTGGALGGTLTTSANGAVSGVFAIPSPTVSGNPAWQTGTINFRLTSSSTNELSRDLETFAQVDYVASGILETRERDLVGTRNARIITNDVSESVRTRREFAQERTQFFDPLAQSFISESTTGEFITKIDVFFSTKDTTIPVTLQIREMDNGYPTKKIIPFGSVTLNPASVNVDVSTGATATTFTFDSPVYIAPGIEYAIVLMTDSQDYNVWISRMGETDVTAGRFINDQPYLGVLFKSQNNSTWTAFDFEDLKFTLYRASFTTNQSGTLTLNNDALSTQTLKANSIESFASTALVKVRQTDHHMYSTSNNVTIAGVSSGLSTTLNGAINDSAAPVLDSVTNFTDTSGVYNIISSTYYIKIDDEIISYTSVSTKTLSGTVTRGARGTTAAAHADGATVEFYQFNGLILDEINKTHAAVANVGIDSYTVATTLSAETAGTFGGSSITATQNALFDTFKALVPTLGFPETTLNTTIECTSGTSPDGGQTSFTKAGTGVSFDLNENYNFDVPKLIASGINETNEMSGVKSLSLNFVLNSTSEFVSPYIDLDRKSLVCVANRITNIDSSSDVYPTTDFVDAIEPDGDSGETVYITKKVGLKSPATSLRVILDAHKPATADIKVMFKILRSDDASNFDDLGWQYFNTTGTTDDTVSANTTKDDFTEYQYTAGKKDDGTGSALDEFISFAIKIKMQGTNCADVPRIKDLRALALAT